MPEVDVDRSVWCPRAGPAVSFIKTPYPRPTNATTVVFAQTKNPRGQSFILALREFMCQRIVHNCTQRKESNMVLLIAAFPHSLDVPAVEVLHMEICVMPVFAVAPCQCF